MNRKAILIGNTSGLQGVKVDINRFKNFLMSNVGGVWRDSEIDVVVNGKKIELLKKIDTLKRQSLDYLIVMYSGHGGQRRQTILEINSEEETIEETDLLQIATRQLNVYDCCRAYIIPTGKLAEDVLIRAYASESDQTKIRRLYDTRIMEAIPQQAQLYSCSIGQVSYDTSDGAVYLNNLIKAASSFNFGEKYKLVGLAHEAAIAPTIANSKEKKEGLQVPDAKLPKCLTSQQLVISINA